jgi:hypothetical protein
MAKFGSERIPSDAAVSRSQPGSGADQFLILVERACPNAGQLTARRDVLRRGFWCISFIGVRLIPVALAGWPPAGYLEKPQVTKGVLLLAWPAPKSRFAVTGLACIKSQEQKKEQKKEQKQKQANASAKLKYEAR